MILAAVTLLLEAVEEGVAAGGGDEGPAAALPRLAGGEAGDDADGAEEAAAAAAVRLRPVVAGVLAEAAAAPFPPLKLLTMRRILRSRLVLVFVWVICKPLPATTGCVRIYTVLHQDHHCGNQLLLSASAALTSLTCFRSTE